MIFQQSLLCSAHNFRRIPLFGKRLSKPLVNLNHQERETSAINPTSILLQNGPLLELRGGAKRSGRTATLSSSVKSKAKARSATGKTKVGAKADKDEKKSALSNTMSKYNKILPLTRIHITMVALVTMLGLVLGEEMTQSLLALDPTRVIYGMEVWRPLSAAAFLGPPSISWLMSGYYLFQYGSTLEGAYGTAQHFMFLLTQISMLSIMSILTGQPFFAPSLITAMLHVLSRSTPHQKVKWLIFNVPYWSLPYGLMASDVLQAQSLMAALPHILGILSGHMYFFHKFIWPKMGHTDWLVPPEFVRKRLELASSSAEETSKASVEKALKKRKRSKGRKLGGK